MNSCIGIVALLMLGLLLPETGVARFLSVGTIVIFPLHPLIFSVFSGMTMYIFKLSHTFQDHFWVSCMFTISSIAICYPVSAFLSKHVPFAIGKQRKIK